MKHKGRELKVKTADGKQTTPHVSLIQIIKKRKKDPISGPIFREWERKGAFRILERWQKQGIDDVAIYIVIGCLLYSRLQLLIVPYINEEVTSLKRSSHSIGKGIKKIQKTIKAIEPPFQKKELIPEVEKILREISSLKVKKKTYDSIARSLRDRHSSIFLYKKGNVPKIPAVDVTRDIPIVLAHNLLATRVGISAYGREKSVPFEYQKDLLTLFHNSDPQHFHEGLTFSTLSQRISSINKKYTKLVALSAKQLLKFLSSMSART